MHKGATVWAVGTMKQDSGNVMHKESKKEGKKGRVKERDKFYVQK